jgi:hypothetical protein
MLVTEVTEGCLFALNTRAVERRTSSTTYDHAQAQPSILQYFNTSILQYSNTSILQSFNPSSFRTSLALGPPDPRTAIVLNRYLDRVICPFVIASMIMIHPLIHLNPEATESET